MVVHYPLIMRYLLWVLRARFPMNSWLVVEPLWKILVKLEVFPNFRGENKKCLKPPTSLLWGLRARFPMNSVFSTRPKLPQNGLDSSCGWRVPQPATGATRNTRGARGMWISILQQVRIRPEKRSVQVGSSNGWNLKIHGWSTYPPRVTYHPHQKYGLMMRAYENHWFPLIRPAIKPLVLRGVG